MKFASPAMIFFFVLGISFGQDIPKKPADYLDSEVIVNPDNGDRIICNQLQVIFKSEIPDDQKQSAIKKVKGRMAGYLDDLDIYQIIVQNRNCDFQILKSQREKLEKDRTIYQVSYRVVEGSGLDKIDVTRLKPKRHGQLDMQPAERKTREAPSEMELALNQNKATLHTCLTQFPGVHGQMEFRIIIDEQGAVRQTVVLQSSVKNKKITDCVKYKVGKWEGFPEEPKGFDRNMEFTFKF
jgi:hypothetical protein